MSGAGDPIVVPRSERVDDDTIYVPCEVCGCRVLFSAYVDHCTSFHGTSLIAPLPPSIESEHDFPPLGSSPEEGSSLQNRSERPRRVSFARRLIEVSVHDSMPMFNPIRNPSSYSEATYSYRLMHGVRPDVATLLEPLSKDEVARLSHDDLCTVCLCRLDGKPEETPEQNENENESEHQPKEIKRIIACKHMFCVLCITRWLSKSNFCPVCKHVVIANDESANEIRTLMLTPPVMTRIRRGNVDIIDSIRDARAVARPLVRGSPGDTFSITFQNRYAEAEQHSIIEYLRSGEDGDDEDEDDDEDDEDEDEYDEDREEWP